MSPDRPRTQADRRAATRGALIAAGRALFAERGFAGAGREDIAEQAGVTRGALYHHFASKEDLFRAVYEQVEEQLCEGIAVAALAGDDPIAQLHIGATAFLEAAATPEIRRIVLIDAPAVLTVEARRELGDRYGLGMVRAALQAVEDVGRLRLGPVDPLARIMLAALHDAATAVAEGDDPAAVSAVIDGLVDLLTSTA